MSFQFAPFRLSRVSVVYGFAFAVLIWLIQTVSARAEMIITIDPKTFQAESRDYFDVFIESTVEQNLLIASYKLEITPQVGNTASLLFRDTFDPSDPLNIDNQSISEQSSANYLFFGNTSDANFSSVRQPDRLVLIGSDSEDTGLVGINMLANQKYLMTRVEVFTENPGTGTFTVKLVNDPAQTFFFDLSASPIAIDSSSFDGTTFSISSVPEPSSILLGLAGSTLLGVYRWRRARLAERALV
jgi:hypothetical protein